MRSAPIRSARRGSVGSSGSKLIQHWRRKYSLGPQGEPARLLGVGLDLVVHALEDRRRPAAAGLEDQELEIGEALADAAHEETPERDDRVDRRADRDAQRRAADHVVGDLRRFADAAVWRMRLNMRAALCTSVCVAGCNPTGIPSSWHTAQNGS